MKDLLNGYIQHPPFSIQIEPTEGCNLGCSFCGIRGIKEKGTKPWNFMTLETAKRIASQIAEKGWKSKIVFGMHGEPTLNPNFIEIVAIFRRYLPNAIISSYTNGYALNRNVKLVNELFEVGMNNLLVDCYNVDGDWVFVDKVKGVEIQQHGRGVELIPNKQCRRILLLPSINLKENQTATHRLANHCGAAAPLDKTFNNKRCTMPFREMSFRYNGWVSLCCDDFRGEYPIGNIHDMDIEDIWNSPRFQAVRIKLFNYDREGFRPCDGCTNISMRVGLLPDPSGKDKDIMPKIINEDVKDVLAEMSNAKPLATVYKRKWEK